MSRGLVPVERVTDRILVLRGQRVILDADLAKLYGVTTKRLNEQVRRNISRFPDDFMFRLNRAEAEGLNRSQYATGSQKHRDPGHPPLVFTEHGAIMAASVLNTPRAVAASLFVVRAFVRLREMLATHKELAVKVSELEHRVEGHDSSIRSLVSTIRRLMEPLSQPVKKIGFR